ncbi:VOC family protein [Roseobacter sp. YSTF-M11]|uniref:VOC family protein n=1 Tax=Roseobacter insulae TaxID=2859783 RepID=A0A9X1FV25_9RHOB|nr:VOC family protein [Roseobacter insulae]MBW4707867.1 VOC family protein [Roseobacter insulae]
MQRITGFGGFFFRAENPEQLAAWYAQHFGITEVPKDYVTPVWTQDQGPTVFAPFAKDTKYFGDADKQWMLNFRVDDLDAMIAQLQAAGITVEKHPEELPNGSFARVYDPEGNPIELWQPKDPEGAE